MRGNYHMSGNAIVIQLYLLLGLLVSSCCVGFHHFPRSPSKLSQQLSCTVQKSYLQRTSNVLKQVATRNYLRNVIDRFSRSYFLPRLHILSQYDLIKKSRTSKLHCIHRNADEWHTFNQSSNFYDLPRAHYNWSDSAYFAENTDKSLSPSYNRSIGVKHRFLRPSLHFRKRLNFFNRSFLRYVTPWLNAIRHKWSILLNQFVKIAHHLIIRPLPLTQAVLLAMFYYSYVFHHDAIRNFKPFKNLLRIPILGKTSINLSILSIIVVSSGLYRIFRTCFTHKLPSKSESLHSNKDCYFSFPSYNQICFDQRFFTDNSNIHKLCKVPLRLQTCRIRSNIRGFLSFFYPRLPWRNLKTIPLISTLTTVLLLIASFILSGYVFALFDLLMPIMKFYKLPVNVNFMHSFQVLLSHLCWILLGSISLKRNSKFPLLSFVDSTEITSFPSIENSRNVTTTNNMTCRTSGEKNMLSKSSSQKWNVVQWYRMSLSDNWLWWVIGGFCSSILMYSLSDKVNHFVMPKSVFETCGDYVVQRLIESDEIGNFNDNNMNIDSQPVRNEDKLRFGRGRNRKFIHGMYYFLGAIAPCLSAPWWEEILYRGFLLSSLSTYFPNLSLNINLIISALIFSAHHMNIACAIPLFGLGYLWSIIYIYSRNLIVPILIHSLWNSRIFIGYWFNIQF